MRILSISNVPHDPNSGSGYVITGYVDGLRRRGHVVDAYGPEDYDVVFTRLGKRYRKMICAALFGVTKFIRGSYDLVEVWGGDTWLLTVLLRRLFSEVPIVHHSNGIEQHYTTLKRQSSMIPDEQSRWFQFDVSTFYDLGLQASSAVVTVSDFDVPFLKKRGYVPEERLFAIANPLPEFYLDRPFNVERSTRVGYCGSWIPKKGTDVMRSALPGFLREHSAWTFSIVGSGDQDVRCQFPEDVRDQIEVISFLSREDLVDWYESLSIFVLPSIAESFGLVAAEAMACGTPLVATNIGYANSLNDVEEAIVLPEPSPVYLQGALFRLAADENLRRTIAHNGYQAVQSLRWQDAVDQLESIYTRLC